MVEIMKGEKEFISNKRNIVLFYPKLFVKVDT